MRGEVSWRRAAMLALGLLAACAPPDPGGALETGLRLGPAEVTMPADSRLRFMGGVELRGASADFGGISGIEVSADGARFVAVSDAGRWVEGRLIRRDGRLTGVELSRFANMRGPDGARARPVYRDAEGLTIAPGDLDAPRLVSFERDHRVAEFAGPDAPETPFWRRPGWPNFGNNSGIEALARRDDGAVLAIREAKTRNGDQHALWRAPDGTTRPAKMPRSREMLTTGADFGPDGRLYVVDRRLTFTGGFSMRLRRLDVAGDALVDPETLLFLPGPDGADNAEGVSVWRDAAGRIRLTVVTDDNFNMLQRTLLLEFAVVEHAAPAVSEK